MTAGLYHIEAEAGIQRVVSALWKDSAGSAVNTAGYSASCEIWEQMGTAPVVTLGASAVGTAGYVSLGTVGDFTILLDHRLTAALGAAAPVYWYVLDVSDSGSTPTVRLLEGELRLSTGGAP